MSYEYPAWVQMETELDKYEQDRQAHLDREATKLGPNGKRQLSKFNDAADALLKGIKDLAGVDGIVHLAELAKSGDFQQGKVFALLEEHVCIKFGWEAMGMLR